MTAESSLTRTDPYSYDCVDMIATANWVIRPSKTMVTGATKLETQNNVGTILTI
jgi:hypothetical protein